MRSFAPRRYPGLGVLPCEGSSLRLSTDCFEAAVRSTGNASKQMRIETWESIFPTTLNPFRIEPVWRSLLNWRCIGCCRNSRVARCRCRSGVCRAMAGFGTKDLLQKLHSYRYDYRTCRLKRSDQNTDRACFRHPLSRSPFQLSHVSKAPL